MSFYSNTQFEKEKYSKLFIVLLLFFLVLHLLNFALSRMYPFVDLSFHLAAATIYRHFGEATNQFDQFYYLDTFLKPNTFHMWFCSLPVFPSVEAGNKVYYVLYSLLLPLSVFLFIKEIGGRIWFTLLSFTLLYSYSVVFGFTGYTLAIPTIIFILLLQLKSLEHPTFLNKILISGLLLVLFFLHALVTLFCIGIIVLSSVLLNVKSLKKIILHLLVVLPVLILIGYWWTTSQGGTNTGDFIKEYYSGEFFSTFISRINILYLDNIFIFKGVAGNLVGLLFSGIIYGSLLLALYINKGKILLSIQDPKAAFLWIFFICAVLAHFILPPRLPEQEILYERFSVFAGISALLLSSYYWGFINAYNIKPVIAIATTIHLILWVHFFYSFAQENKYFTEEIFPDNTKGVRLAGLIKDYHFRRAQCYIMFPDYYITWKKGIEATSLIDYRFGAIRRKVSTDVLPKFDHWLVKKGTYNNEYNQMEYILTKGELPNVYTDALQGYRIEKKSGPYILYKKSSF